ncbi:hypothetical protein [Bdellovibrio bacteriovorus]|uniref:hypothetical protein n=1 Tax=Bdellovibrio TaxID=958 RepID=UPI0035A8EA73
MDLYKKEKEEAQARINDLENQILQYRQQMAQSQVDLMETMIRDPQFRAALAKQLKADNQR